jgi:hypothetical protein
LGPDSSKGYANAPWRDGDFSIVDGQQKWTVPTTGTYRIEAAGAYGATPGRVVSGEVDLNEGQVLTMLVGQQPNPLTANVVDNVTVGGGGGTFVTVEGTPLIVASGGDGGAYSSGYNKTTSYTDTLNNVFLGFSMSSDGTRIPSINVNLNTFVFEIGIFSYVSGVWSFDNLFVGQETPKISGNGNTVICTDPYTLNSNIRVFEYIVSIWTNTHNIPSPFPSQTGFGQSFDISYDGKTMVVGSYNGGLGWVGVYTKNEDLTWSEPFVFTPTSTNNFGSVVAMSGNGMFACVAAGDGVWVYTRSGNTWENPQQVTTFSGSTVQSLGISYDGTIVMEDTFPRNTVRLYKNFSFSKEISYVVVSQPPSIQMSSDGSTILFATHNETYVYKGPNWDTQETVSTTTNQLTSLAPRTAMNANGSRVMNCVLSLSSPSIDLYDFIPGGSPGSFLPQGTGIGIESAGYLTDGQVTDPYFKFLRPQAYVDGGFGNQYQYGVQSEGGFGGGQSPLNLRTSLTSITGYKQIRPSINLNLTNQVYAIALSADGNTFLVSIDVSTNVYVYSTNQWTSSTVDTRVDNGINGVSISSDGTVWLVGSSIWRNGTFEQALLPSANGAWLRPNRRFHCYLNALTPDGNTAVVSTSTGVCYVFRYSNGTWDSGTNLPFGEPVSTCTVSTAISADGTKVVFGRWATTGVMAINLYTFANGSWTSTRIYETTSDSIINLSMNSDGSEIVFSTFNVSYKYTNGTLSSLSEDIAATLLFSRTNPNNYAYTYLDSVYAPFVPLDVKVQLNFQNYLLSFGSSILAVCDSWDSGNKAIVFVDMYNPTTTCTANTSVDYHGYPHDYKVQITGTNSFNGTWDIVTTSSNTFTFQAFGGPTETSGYVSGTTTGISGGGGYTGSAGDGVSGATCYADPIVTLTDLGATSNAAGYVNVTLVDPSPITFETKAINPVVKKNYSNRNLQSIIWSPEFGKYFAVSSPVVNPAVSVVVYSTNLESWTGTESPQGSRSICWSPKLNLFTIGIGVSRDGLTWTEGDVSKTFDIIVWCDFMNCFIGWIRDVYIATYLWKSGDGLNWTEMTDGPLLNHQDLNKISISVGPDSFVVLNGVEINYYVWPFVYTWGPVYTFDGTTWTTTNLTATRSVYYDNQFVLFLTDSTCYTSTDGLTWNYKSSFSFDPTYIQDCIIYENTLYVCISGSETSPHFFSSQNLLTWTQINPIGSEITNTLLKAVVNVNSILLASTYYGKTLASVDFRVWAPLTTSLFRGSEILWATLCFSPETGYLVASGNTNPEGKTVIYYSKDAVTWKSVTLDTTVRDVLASAWMPTIGKFIFNEYYLVDPLDNWSVSIIPGKINPSQYNYSTYAWSPIGKVLICSNGDQTNDGYNWRNDPTVSCGITVGWLYPSTIIANNNGNITTSTDAGKTWITTNYSAAGATFGTSGTLCIVYSGSLMTSTDGITWTPGTTPGNFAFAFCFGIFWISSIKMFAGVFSTGISGDFSVVSLTSDGNNWTTIYSLTENYLRAATWCENINTLVIIPYSGDYTLNITF